MLENYDNKKKKRAKENLVAEKRGPKGLVLKFPCSLLLKHLAYCCSSVRKLPLWFVENKFSEHNCHYHHHENSCDCLQRTLMVRLVDVPA